MAAQGKASFADTTVDPVGRVAPALQGTRRKPPGIRRVPRGPADDLTGPVALATPSVAPSLAGLPPQFGSLSVGAAGRTFFHVPTTVPAFALALLEPGLALGCLLGWTWLLQGGVNRIDLALCLGVLALSFPGRNRLRMPALAAWSELSALWLARAALIALGLWITDSLGAVDARALAAAWACTVVLTGTATQATNGLTTWWQGRPHRRRRAIVIGAGPLATRVTQALRAQAGRGVDLIGCFDDRLDSRLDPQARPLRRGDLDKVVDFIHRRGVQDVYVTLPLGAREPSLPARGGKPAAAPGSRMAQMLQALQDTTASVHYVPDLLGITIIQGRLQDVNGVPVVGLCETPFTGVNGLLKRAEDVVLASIILMLIAPLMLAVALGVKLSSPGPVLFRQRRNGLDGHEILVWKFRSMRTQDDGPVVRQATRGDPRITPFGAFIRRTSLDELPQFFNVLQGTMSIVGPRPHAVAHNDEYRALVQAYMVRHKVKPGITGWAQVNGHRGETDTLDKMRARVEYDLEYLRHWSLGLDLRIIARTVGLVLGDRHAY